MCAKEIYNTKRELKKQTGYSEMTNEPMHKLHSVRSSWGTFRNFCGPVWIKNKPISVLAIVKPFCTALEKGISNIEKISEIMIIMFTSYASTSGGLSPPLAEA